MNMIEAITSCFSKYATFTGRASRSEYWWFVLFICVTSFVTAVLQPLLYFGFLLASFLPSLAVQCRRLRDAGLSPWFVLLGLIPLIGVALLFMCIVPSKIEDNRYVNSL